MSDAWFPTSQKKEKSKKKTPGKSAHKHNVTTDASLTSLSPSQKIQSVSQGSTDNLPNPIRKNNQTSDPTHSSTNESTLKSTEENIPAYFNQFMKVINDQISQIRQEFTTPSSTPTKDNIQPLPSQVKVPNHSGPSTSEYQTMANVQNAPNSNSTNELESDHPNDTQGTKEMIQDLINTIKRTDKKKKTRRITYSEASDSQYEDIYNPRNNAYYRATRSNKKTSNKKHSSKPSYSDARLKHDLANFGINTDSSNTSSDSDQSSSPSINSGTISQFRIPPVPFVSPQPCPQFDVTKFNREMKSVSIESEDYPAVTSLYDDIQQALIAATQNPGIIPDIEYLTPSFRFDRFIVPHKGTASHRLGITAYITMAKALKKKIMKPSFIHEDCLELRATRDQDAYENDGFKILLNIMSSILPHLGGNCLDVVTEISQIGLIQDDTLNTLYLKFSLLSRRLKISGHHVPATALLTRYFNITMGIAELKPLLAPIFRVFQKHLS